MAVDAGPRLRSLIAFRVSATNGRNLRRGASPDTRQGGRNERSTGSGGYDERRVRPDRGRPARTVGGQRASLWRLGDLSSEGFARRSESAVCVTVQRLVRAGDPALQ